MEKTVPQLISDLASEDQQVRFLAMDKLEELGKADDSAVDLMIENLRHKDVNVRMMLGAVLGKIGAKGEKGLPIMAGMVRDRGENLYLRRSFSSVIAFNWPKASLPVFLDLLRGDEEDMRRSAAGNLGSIPDPRAVDALLEVLTEPNDDFRSTVKESLTRIGDVATEKLLAGLKDKNAFVRVGCATALVKHNHISKEGLEALITLLSDPDEKVRRDATFGFHSLGLDAKEAIPALTEALGDSDEKTRWYVAHVFAFEVASVAQPAIPALIKCLRDESILVRSHAAMALGAIGPEASAAIPVFIDLLNFEKYEDILSPVVAALANMGPGAKVAVPALRKALAKAKKGIPPDFTYDDEYIAEIQEVLEKIDR